MEFDIISLIKIAGLTGIFLAVFIESGIPLGFILPGDSLLFTAGLLAALGYFNIFTLILTTFVGAVLGVNLGYTIGKKAGPLIFKKDSFIFSIKNLERTKDFYEKHGKKTIVLARFLPIIRSLVPLLAGVGNMDYEVFLFYNVLGAGLWAIGLPLAGYLLGNVIPGIDKYLIPLILLIVFISLIPSFKHILGGNSKNSKEVRLP